MATHFSILAWRIPGTEEPVGLPSMGLHRVRHELAAAAVGILKKKKKKNKKTKSKKTWPALWGNYFRTHTSGALSESN